MTGTDGSTREPPPQPGEDTWEFVEELKQPLHQKIAWQRQAPDKGEVSLAGGVDLNFRFPDPGKRLVTAHKDFRRFLRMGGIRSGAFKVITERCRTEVAETYRVTVSGRSCRVRAGDTEGIRRGLIFVEDQMLRTGGPFLPLGAVERVPVIRTRLSRCFFGPIKRPPKNRDELADDVDYYPDEYLNRLAHDGINGLWLTIEFEDLCRTSVIPEFGQDASRRLAKLKRTVKKCLRYGIKIYAFCIEPAGFPEGSPVLAKHPDLGGHESGWNTAFCVSTPQGRAHVEEATRNLFAAVPDLGGLIDISVGERTTHCYSGTLRGINCPRCSRRKPREVLADVLSGMERGMHSVNPDAELISWPYGQYICWGTDLAVDAASHVPPRVILQQNFESSGKARQLGKVRTANDYWLSYIGPSALFRECACAAVKHGNRMSAKLQVGCSHEVATAPWVPVPGHLYRKYKAMHELSVSSAMQCWYFGNYPSLMTKAAGELSFAPFARTEDDFLLTLARRDWGRNAPEVVKAWKHFQRSYFNYPLSKLVGYYGPFHDGPIWPLYLEPRDLPLRPTWLIASPMTREPYPPSGDRIGEFITYSHTTDEMLTLFRRMAEHWNRGSAIFKRLLPDYADEPERQRDIGVALALGLQFQSGYNILRFYLMREDLPDMKRNGRLAALQEMKGLVQHELEIDKELLALCLKDSRLGFHSEAEGYKYYPALIRWRRRQLQDLLAREFPRVERRVRKGGALFPEYTGKTPVGPVYRCKRVSRPPEMNGRPFGGPWDALREEELRFKESPHERKSCRLTAAERRQRRTTWKAGHDGEFLYVGICCREPQMAQVKDGFPDRKVTPYWGNDCAGVMIEPRRLWPLQYYYVNAKGARGQLIIEGGSRYRWQSSAFRDADRWSVILRIPLPCFREPAGPKRPLRLDVFRGLPMIAGQRGDTVYRWLRHRHLTSRLAFRGDNPHSLGWLMLE